MLSKFPTGGAFNSTLVERHVQPWWVSAATPHWAACQHTQTRAHAHTHTQTLQINQKLEKKCEARSAANSNNKKPNKMLPATTKITVVWFVRATQLPPVAAAPMPTSSRAPPSPLPTTTKLWQRQRRFAEPIHIVFVCSSARLPYACCLLHCFVLHSCRQSVSVWRQRSWRAVVLCSVVWENRV